MIEVESKVSVKPSMIGKIRTRAREIGKYARKEFKVDDYYTLESLDSYPEKSFRIRRADGYYVINYKNPISYEKGVHAKNEVEFKVSDIKDFLKTIKDLGFRKFVRKEKRCEIYKIKKNFQIELNNVKNLGWFVEIEYLTNAAGIGKARDEVARVFKMLGFGEKDIVKKGYTKLLWDKMHR